MNRKTIDVQNDGSLSEVHFSPHTHYQGLTQVINSSYLWNIFDPYGEIVNIEGRSGFLDTLADILETIAAYPDASPEKAVFAIVNQGGQWSGTGLTNYYAAFREVLKRYERDSGKGEYTEESYHSSFGDTEVGTCIVQVGKGRYLALSHEAQTPKSISRFGGSSSDDQWLNEQYSPVRNPQIGYLFNGIPFDLEPYIDLGESLGTDLSQAGLAQREAHSIEFQPRQDADIIEYREDESSSLRPQESELVSEVIVENPYYQNPRGIPQASVENLKSGIRHTVERGEEVRWKKHLAAPKYIRVTIGGTFRDEFTSEEQVRLDDVHVLERIGIASHLGAIVHFRGSAHST